jgi:hypothetical protein
MADHIDTYVRNLKSINNTMDRLNKELKVLRIKKRDAQDKLYNAMKIRNLTEYGSIKITQITPKIKTPKKKTKDKKSDAIRFFNEIGIDNPELCWEEYQKTQKYQLVPNEDDE